ncbi:MAG: NHL repeat protein [bacterium ADurb.Bin429]|nr:MAG: NHL repeat protein [bacterium ADurb.Bin429]
MTRQAVDRWLGAGVLAVIAVTAMTAWWLHRQVKHVPAGASIPVTVQATAYREITTIPVTIDQPAALMVDRGTVYIAGKKAIQKHRRRGPRMIGDDTPTTVSGSVTAITYSSASHSAYLAMHDAVTPWLEGVTQEGWPTQPGMRITGLATFEDTVWAADAGNRQVSGFGLDGKIIRTLAKKDEEKGIPGLLLPGGQFDLAVNRRGELFITNPGRHRIEVFDRKGTLLRSWGVASMQPGGFSGCCNPVALAVMPDGSIITAEKGRGRLQRFSDCGNFQEVVADLGKGDGFDLALDGDDILLLDVQAKLVRVFKRTVTE